MSREQREPQVIDALRSGAVPSNATAFTAETVRDILAAYDALRAQLVAAEEARDAATQREEHFHTINAEIAEKLKAAERERDSWRDKNWWYFCLSSALGAVVMQTLRNHIKTPTPEPRREP